MNEMPPAGPRLGVIPWRMTIPPAALLLALLFTGCVTPQPAAQEDAVSAIQTAVAVTVSAASASQAPTATPESSSTAATLLSTSTPPPIPTSTAGIAYTYSSGCNNAAYLRDVTVADGEDMGPGETFTKTWELLNTGSCSWSKGYSVVFVDGTMMQATSAGLGTMVATGAAGDVSVELTAPEDEGTYTAYWRLADASGTLFGEQFYVQIVVTGDAATITPTPATETATVSATATSTPTNESATSTLDPTATGSGTLTPTSGETGSSPGETPHAKKIRT